MKSVQPASESSYYDNLPYKSYSFPCSHPARLAAVAHLFGLNPPENKKFRMLELGSASGGNLIPLAMFYPEAEVIGVDYSQVQIEQGQKVIKALDLEKRVQLLCQSITEIDKDIGQFDYIICHGVYSWVPAEVQDAIIATIQNHLKPNGIAYVSYNVYPGWKRLEIIRDMMLYHTRQMSDNKPQERMAQGRAIVEFIRNLSHETSGIRQMIDAPWDGLKDKEDSYLAHEFLEPVNQPCYFLDFAEKLAAHDLTYLADAEPAISFIQNLPEEKVKQLIQASHNSQVMLEQYMDFLYFRQFRKSLIVHQSAANSIKRKIPIEVFDKLNFSFNSCVEKQRDEETVSDENATTAHAGNVAVDKNTEAPTPRQTGYRFVFDSNRTITTYNEDDYALLKSMTELKGQVFNKEELLKLTRKNHKSPQLEKRSSNLLNSLSLNGITELWYQLPSESPIFEVEERPYIPELMRRFYKETGHLSNYRHSTVHLNIIQKEIFDLLDGEHDHDQLKAHLKDAFKEERIRLFDKSNQPLTEEDRVDEELKHHLQQALELFKLTGAFYKKPAKK